MTAFSCSIALCFKKTRSTSFRSVLTGFLLLAFLCTEGFAEYEITDSFGKHRFSAPPTEGVVTTDWALLEQMLDLGIAPIGAPEVARFKHYVGHPNLPQDIADIGLRSTPSIGSLRQLKPELIILGTGQKSFARPFSQIAYVLYYQSFSERYRTNGKKSRVRFLQLAELFQKTTLAEQLLAKRDARIAALKQQLNQHFSGSLPNITLMRFSSEQKALVYGHNSMPHHALSLLGLTTKVKVGKNRWGEKEIPIAKLKDTTEGYLIYFLPVDAPEVLQSAAWQSLPLVKQNKVFSGGKVWSYGGAMSVGRIAEAVSQALLQTPKR